MDINVSIKFKIKNAIDKEVLERDFNGDIMECAKFLIEEEGLVGIVQDDWEYLMADSTIEQPEAR